MSRIFISYRRTDSADITDRMFDHLTLHFAKKDIFKDVDSIPLGVDFKNSISDAVHSCDVILAVIGKNWLYSTNKQGNLRLLDPNDFVRIELEAGLERNIPVIPVLVSGADMPTMEELPASLRPLIYRNAISLRSDPDFSVGIHRIINALTKILQNNKISKSTIILNTIKAIKSTLRTSFTYIAISTLLFLLFLGGYLGYLEFSSHHSYGNVDECKRPNPPISCLFK